MAIILDADVIIRGERGAFDLKGWLETRPDEQFEIAAVTVAELWHGVERAEGARKAARLRYLESFLGPLPVVSYTKQTAVEHARIWAELERAGKKIGSYDVIVAATARERGSAVATFNRRHFDNVPGLVVIEPQ